MSAWLKALCSSGRAGTGKEDCRAGEIRSVLAKRTGVSGPRHTTMVSARVMAVNEQVFLFAPRLLS